MRRRNGELRSVRRKLLVVTMNALMPITSPNKNKELLS